MFRLPILLAVLLLDGCAARTEALPDPLAAGWKGEPVCEQLLDDRERRVLRCRFAPGVGHERHYHAPHLGYTIAGGRVQITDATGTEILEPEDGSLFVSDGVEWHEVLNVGDTTAEYLIVEIK